MTVTWPVLRFTAHAELEACASGISKSNESLESEGLVGIRTFSRWSHSELLPPILQLQATKAGKFRGPRCLVLLRLSCPLAVVLDSIVAALDGLTGIIKS